jgi:hypothetical protein
MPLSMIGSGNSRVPQDSSRSTAILSHGSSVADFSRLEAEPCAAPGQIHTTWHDGSGTLPGRDANDLGGRTEWRDR